MVKVEGLKSPIVSKTKMKICFAFLYIIVLSCDNNEHAIKKVPLNNDEGYALFEYYLKNGDTILDGNFKIFNSEDNIKRSGKYTQNEFLGLYTDYHDNGHVECTRFRKSGKNIGEITWYRADQTIELYNFFDDLGNLNFFAKYDKLGTLESCEGKILFEIYQFKLRAQNKQKIYSLGDKVKYQFMFPNIPNTKRDFYYELLDYDNSKIERDVKKIEPVTLEIQEPAVKKGKNTIKAYITYTFTDERKITLSDTTSFDFYVE